ncbi:MarR family winged helix-turn-helix transcriptional regulator [Oceanospirillum sp.]|uniref:MarR family winged helix-turn-helix transcriptional regulator n=1 Tax=Oceanospirillum sp. TaxID=2021254 RepID=UPI003A901145
MSSVDNSEANSSLLKLDNQLCFSLYSATNAITRAYRPLLDALDLTYLQYMAMMVLWEEQKVSVKRLGERLHLDSGTLTPLLKRLEAKTLIVRGRSPDDERVRVITLTDAGQLLKVRAETVPEQVICQTCMPLDELTQMKYLCDQLLKNLTS